MTTCETCGSVVTQPVEGSITSVDIDVSYDFQGGKWKAKVFLFASIGEVGDELGEGSCGYNYEGVFDTPVLAWEFVARHAKQFTEGKS